MYSSTALSFDDFLIRFENSFDNDQLFASLRVKLYTKKQGEKQPVAVFITEQFALARRVLPVLNTRL